LLEDDHGNLLVDPHNILNTDKNYFSQLLNVCLLAVNDIKIHTDELLVPEPNYLAFISAIKNLEWYGISCLKCYPTTITYSGIKLNWKQVHSNKMLSPNCLITLQSRSP
jgi:hypothetical protein